MPDRSSSKKRRWPITRVLRYVSQGGFALYILSLSLQHNLANEATTTIPSIDALCPFGGIETMWRYVSQGLYVPKTHLSNFVLLIGLVVGAALAGGSFCGWVCPLGALQDLTEGISRRLKLSRITLPVTVDRWLQYGRFLVLLGIIYGTIATVRLWFADFDPYRTFFGLGWLFEFDPITQWTAYTVTVVVVVASLFIRRFWCRYLCPLGGLISVVQRLSLLKIQRDPAVCIDCGKCARVCPARLPVDKTIRTGANCIGCLDCVESCPKPGALQIGALLPRGRVLHRYVVPVVVIAVLLGTSNLAQVMGYWSTTGKDQIMVDESGKADPTGIKGWMTLAQVSETYGVPLAPLYERLAIPAEQDPQTALKDLEAVVPGFEVELVRETVAKYLQESGKPAPESP